MHAPQGETPPQREACTPQLESNPYLLQQRHSLAKNKFKKKDAESHLWVSGREAGAQFTLAKGSPVSANHVWFGPTAAASLGICYNASPVAPPRPTECETPEVLTRPPGEADVMLDAAHLWEP